MCERRGSRRKEEDAGLTEEALLKKFSDLDLTKQCPFCKNKDKKFNHSHEKCNWRPGDLWHGLKGEKLSEARTKFFTELKERRSVKRRDSRKAKVKAKRKVAKTKEEESESDEELVSNWWYNTNDTRQVTFDLTLSP